MTTNEILELFLEVFPDETVKRGQGITKVQAETINAIVFELKQRKEGVKALRRSSTP